MEGMFLRNVKENYNRKHKERREDINIYKDVYDKQTNDKIAT